MGGGGREEGKWRPLSYICSRPGDERGWTGRGWADRVSGPRVCCLLHYTSYFSSPYNPLAWFLSFWVGKCLNSHELDGRDL